MCEEQNRSKRGRDLSSLFGDDSSDEEYPKKSKYRSSTESMISRPKIDIDSHCLDQFKNPDPEDVMESSTNHRKHESSSSHRSEHSHRHRREENGKNDHHHKSRDHHSHDYKEMEDRDHSSKRKTSELSRLDSNDDDYTETNTSTVSDSSIQQMESKDDWAILKAAEARREKEQMFEELQSDVRYSEQKNNSPGMVPKYRMNKADIGALVVKLLTPAYIERRFESRDLFKTIARSISHAMIEKDEREIKQYVAEFLRKNEEITSHTTL